MIFSEKVRAAHKAVEIAIEGGDLVRPLACERCHGSPKPIEVVTTSGEVIMKTQIHAHHEDYDLPLYVQWLCMRCHKIRHGQERPRTTDAAREIVRRWCASSLAAWKTPSVETAREEARGS